MKVFKTVKERVDGEEGFQLTFKNGNTISVVFGKYTYSDQGKTTAETAAWNSNGDWMLFQDGKWLVIKEGNEVMPRCTPEEVAEMIFTLSKL